MKMKTWFVSLPVTGTATIEVQAETEEGAIDAALSAELTVEHLREWEAIRQIVRGNIFCGIRNEAEAVEA